MTQMNNRTRVRDNMLAMDRRSHAYGEDTTAAAMMVMLTRARMSSRRGLTVRDRVRLINTWLW
jgi:hypothetical protein